MNKEPCHVYFALLEDFHQQCFLKAKNLVSAGEPPVGPQGLFIFEQKSLVYLVQQICPQIEMLHLLWDKTQLPCNTDPSCSCIQHMVDAPYLEVR